MTSDLGRVTTNCIAPAESFCNCGDVRSRTSYNPAIPNSRNENKIAVTSDLGRVTTQLEVLTTPQAIAVTSDLGRVTTLAEDLGPEAKKIAVTSDLGRVTT